MATFVALWRMTGVRRKISRMMHERRSAQKYPNLLDFLMVEPSGIEPLTS